MNKLHHKKVVSRWSADLVPTTYRPLTDHLPTTYRPSTDHLPTTYPPLTDHLPTTYRPSTDHVPTTYPPLTDHLPTTFFTLQLVHDYHDPVWRLLISSTQWGFEISAVHCLFSTLAAAKRLIEH